MDSQTCLSQMHTIRLKRPWLRERQVDGQESSAQRVDAPDDSPLLDGVGVTTYRRKFNRPTGLDQGDEVFLSIESWTGGSMEVRLNGEELPAVGSAINVGVMSLLQPHNELVVRITDAGETQGRITGEVALRIQ